MPDKLTPEDRNYPCVPLSYSKEFRFQTKTASCVLCSTKYFLLHKTTCPLAVARGQAGSLQSRTPFTGEEFIIKAHGYGE